MVPLHWRKYIDRFPTLTGGSPRTQALMATDAQLREQLRGLTEEWDESGTSEIT